MALSRRLLQADAPVVMALTAMLRNHFDQNRDAVTLILDERRGEQQLTGGIQLRRHSDAETSEVVFVAPAANKSDQTHQIWQQLLSSACQYAGEHHKQRIILAVVSEVYAPLPVNTEVGDGPEELLHRLGFDTYAYETLYYLPSIAPSNQCDPAPDVRPCTKSDLLSLDALYAQVAPRNVRQAEQLPWAEFGGDINQRGNWRTNDFVVGGEGQLQGALRVVRGQTGYWLKILPAPDYPDCAARLVQHGLSILAALPPQPIYCSTRDYETGVQTALVDHAFEPLARQALLVKHLVVWVKDEKLVHALQEVKPQVQPANAMLGNFHQLQSEGGPNGQK